MHGVQESETDEEEESTLSEELDDIHVDADAARQLSKKRRALVSMSFIISGSSSSFQKQGLAGSTCEHTGGHPFSVVIAVNMHFYERPIWMRWICAIPAECPANCLDNGARAETDC